MLLGNKTNIISACAYIAHARKLRVVGTGALCCFVLLSLLTILPVSYKGNDAEAIYAPATATLAIVSSKDTASVDIAPASNTGTFAISAAADQAEFTVTTDNLTGYSLNIAGTDTSGQLVNSTTGDTLDSISANVNESTFRTGAAGTYNNKWGYRLSINSAATTDFLSAPTTSSKTIHATVLPNTTADNYKLGVGARVDYSKPVGTYTNTFVLTAVGNPISYQINYLDNTGSGGTTGSDVSGLPSSETESGVTAASFTLSSSEPTRTDYTFIGWCYGDVTHNATGIDTCAAGTGTTGTVYQAGDTFDFASLSTTITNVANLYAMWRGRGSSMQDFTATMCAAQASSGPVLVEDVRDGETYNVRYINGNCWMIQNLRYVGDTGSASGTMTMKAATSNVAADNNISYADLDKTITSSGYSTYTDARIHIATSDQIPSGATYTAHDMGVWYNYAATSAMTIIGDSTTDSAIYSICPAGWRLPNSTEFNTLTTYENDFAVIVGGYYNSGSIANPDRGYWVAANGSSGINRYQLVWNPSTSVLGTSGAFSRMSGLFVRCIRNTDSTTITFDGNGADSGSMGTQVINVTGSGNPSGKLNPNTFVRDGYYFAGWNTARDGSGTSYTNGGIYTAPVSGDTNITLYAQWFNGPTIQDFTTSMCESQASSNSVQVVDKRDGNLYNVRYADGNCWMTQNLRYIGDTGSPDDSMIMKAATSNINVDKDISYADLDSTINSSSTSYASYANARIHVATSDQVPSGATYTADDMGVWYNYAAASAMTITGSSNFTYSTYDICPAGWRLPTHNEQEGVNLSSAALGDPVTGGYYSSGSLGSPTYGYWWSSTSSSTNTRYHFRLTVSSGSSSVGTGSYNRRYGEYVRCVRRNVTTITFNGNGSDGGSMAAQTITDSGTLNPNAFTRTDYTFMGWNTAADGSGTSYLDEATYTAGASENVTLYAQWAPALQDFTAAMCNDYASSRAIQLRDRRDGELYYVQKLADGNCWLLEDLRLDPTAVSLADLKGNTNATDQILTYFKNGGGSSPYPATGVTTKTASGGTWTNSFTVPSVSTQYSGVEQAAVDPAPAGKTGAYYNYCAASAGSYCYGSGGGTGDAQYDICPAGWKLPTGLQAAGSYYYLYNTGYSATVADFEAALRTTLNGYASNAGNTTSRGTNVMYWTSSRYTGSNMYRPTITKSAFTQSNYQRSYGFSVRCILK